VDRARRVPDDVMKSRIENSLKDIFSMSDYSDKISADFL
jgi:hypothetical protein